MRQGSMKQWGWLVMVSMVIGTARLAVACPSGQSCPAGKDCVADSSLCVATTTTTTTTTTTSATSSAPTATKDQLGLVLEPLQNNIVRAFHFNNQTKEWTFYDSRPEFASVNTLTDLTEGEVYWILADTSTLVQSDAESASIPLREGWNTVIWK